MKTVGLSKMQGDLEFWDSRKTYVEYLWPCNVQGHFEVIQHFSQNGMQLGNIGS